MFEYLNIAGLVFIGFMFLVLFIVNKTFKNKTPGFNLMVLFLAGLLFTDALIQSNSAEDSIDAYKSAKVLKCHSPGGIYSSGDSYRVSSKDGWKIYKGEFVKESLVLKPNMCEIW